MHAGPGHGRCDVGVQVLLVGCGPMAVAHAHVLADLSCELIVLGRGEASAAAFADETGVRPHIGGVERGLESLAEVPELAVVAVPTPALAPVTKALLEAGVRRVLVEKPAGLSRDEVAGVAALAVDRGAAVLVGYNRRFYASVRRARELIAEDRGAGSFVFEFTELAHRVEQTGHPDSVKSRWFLANSTHVVDLAFFLGGEPIELRCHTAGSLSWHPVARFAGSGRTATGALFAYHADWSGPGRWGVEVTTPTRRLSLRPLETLSEQVRGEFAASDVPLDDDLDERFKPGLHEQDRRFLEGDLDDMIDIHAQLVRFDQVYLRILGE